MIGFAAPWVLIALTLLPAIWWLLRVTPPAPRTIRFPAIRLLRDLAVREETPARTPLWLILMRLFLAGLLIVALAGPILRPSAAPPGRGPEVIVIDNGWAAADVWPAIQTSLLAEIDRDQRAGVAVVLIPTARPASNAPVDALGPFPAAEARRAASALEPMPWATDRDAAAGILARYDGRSPAVWLSDGTDSGGAETLGQAISGFVQPTVRVPDGNALARLLLPPEPGPELALKIRRPTGGIAVPLTLVARAADGRPLGEAAASFDAGETVALAKFDLPSEIRNQVARIDLAGARSVGATILLDERWRRRTVAILTPPAGAEPDELLSASFYLQRALQPFADVRTGNLTTLMPGQPAVLVIPDAAPLSPAERREIAGWVAKGGVLLRFAGPRLAAADPADDALLPTELRTGGRSLSGALSWTEPASLAPFPPDGPLAGLDIPKDVTVSRQILAEPGIDLDRKVWARLIDGTPLITADRRQAGAVVLVHTSADPSWSNLALSGLFPHILRRIVAYSAGVGHPAEHGALEPYRVLDGFGRLQPPSGAASAILAEAFDGTSPDPQAPPGYYGEADSRRALNLTQSVTDIAPLRALANVARQDYAAPGEVPLAPSLLAAVLALAAIDTIVALWLGGSLPRLPRASGFRRAAGLLVAAMLLTMLANAHGAWAATAEGPDARLAEAAAQVTLGYILTGDDPIDRISRAGLDGLVRQLTLRTSIDHAAPASVDLERDELSVYPLLYWPISASARPLSDQAKDRLNRYLANGGVILIDTLAAGGGAGGQVAGTPADLGRLIQGLDIPTLAPIPAGHVLTKSFYLLDQFPGRLPSGEIWVERDQDARNDGVSSVVVGGGDWAEAWASDGGGAPLPSRSFRDDRQREWSYRFGVNLVMYALTGNYKADLVHAHDIQQRLGQ